MGGNVIIDGIKADRIDLLHVDRDTLVQEVDELLSTLNQLHNTFNKRQIWNDSLFNSKQFLSGSSYHLFNVDDIPTYQFVLKKDTVGDIDLMVDINTKDSIRRMLDSLTGYVDFEKWKLIGYKTSAGQYITLWHFNQFNLNIQIDFELVEFENGEPTEWSKFSHSSSWDDIIQDIKGFHHKYMLQSIAASRTKERIVLLTGKTKKPKIVEKSQLAFSVQRGLRWRYIPTELFDNGIPVFNELTSDESIFHTDLDSILEILFGVKSLMYKNEIKSFNGCIRLIQRFLPEHIKSIVDDYVGRMFSVNSQMIVRDNPVKDYDEKVTGLMFICEKLDIDLDVNYSKIISDYYSRGLNND
jgi:hypothetical protein